MVSEFLCAAQGRFHRSALFSNLPIFALLVLTHQTVVCYNYPQSLEVMKLNHGDILDSEEMEGQPTTKIIKYGSETNDDGYWNAGNMVNRTESHRLFQFWRACMHACKAKVENWMIRAENNHNTKWGDGVEQDMVFLDGDKDWRTGVPIPPES
ncbi:hypothetical protein V8E54_002726 [Elaphomyces granulatus]